MEVGKIEDIIITAVKLHGATLMGDDFIGYKFIGDGGATWNQHVENSYMEGEDVSFLTLSWLKANDIPVLEFESKAWNK